MVDRIPSVDAGGTYQFPNEVRQRQALNFGDSSAPEGAALLAVVTPLASIGSHTRNIMEFLLSGETLDTSGSTSVSALFQRAVDQLTTEYASQSTSFGVVGFQIYVPDGRYRLDTKVTWATGVGIRGEHRDNVVFLPQDDQSAFEFTSTAYMEDCRFSDFTIDGIAQTSAIYTASIKGIYMKQMRRALFERVTIKNTWATGFGVDKLDGARFVDCVADTCGRGLSVLGRDPQISTGHSGFGIGTGGLLIEQVSIIGCVARANGLYGIFTEVQGGSTKWPKGVVIADNYVYNNWVGIKDAGSTGAIIHHNQIVKNKYAGFSLDATPLVANAGQWGLFEGNVVTESGSAPGAYTPAGIILGACSLGGYTIRGNDIYANAGPGILAASTAVLGARFTISGNRIHGNAGNGFAVGVATTDMQIRDNEFFDNVGADLALTGAVSSAGLTITGNDYRAGGIINVHTLTDSVTTPNRGAAFTGAYLKDLFAGSAGSLNGRAAPDGSAKNVWAVAAGTDFATDGSGHALATVGTSAAFALIHTDVADGRIKATVSALLASLTNRRAAVIFRYQDSTNFWRLSARPASGVGTWRLQKVIGGTSTDVGLAGPTAVAGDFVELVMAGSSITWKVNGTTIDTATDSALLGLERVGLWGQFNTDPTSSWDSFEYYLP